MSNKINLTLKIWKQKNCKDKGVFITHEMKDVSTEISFLEMMDMANQQLIHQGKEPVEFDHDCREGICGACGFTINGEPHGPEKGVTVCQLHMRSFKDGQTLVVEPFRARAFSVVKDLVVDRSSFDRIIQSGGYISAKTGSAPEANTTLVPKEDADEAFASATCIGCGACVAACKNASANLFVSAKLSHLSLLPQGQPERKARTVKMVDQMDKEGFGSCTNTGACSRACPKEISLTNIARMNRELFKAKLS